MNTLAKHDLAWILKRLPKTVKDLLQSRPEVFLAGGFIRSVIANEPVNDIDLFVSSKLTAKWVANHLSNHGEFDLWETDNAITVKTPKMPIQVIHRWTYTSVIECVQSFDFTIAMAALHYSDEAWRSVIHEDFYADLAAKRLVYTSPKRNEDAGGSILRVLKFYQRGYRIPLDSLSAVVTRLMRGVNWCASQLNEKPSAGLPYNEEELSFVLTGLLREVDPAIDPDHIAHLPSVNEAAPAAE